MRRWFEGGFKANLGALSLNTIEHRLWVLSTAHQLKKLASPTHEAAVQELLRRARRAYASRGRRSTPKPALTRKPLEAMLATCTDGLVRDRALLTFTFASGGRRRSEVPAATIENLTALEDGGFRYRLGHSKSDQAGTEDNPNATKASRWACG